MASHQLVPYRHVVWLRSYTVDSGTAIHASCCRQSWTNHSIFLLIAPQRRAYAAEAAHASAEAATATVSSSDAGILRGILHKSRADTSSVNDSTQSARSRLLRFTDIPATQQLMDAFETLTPRTKPLYDVSSWLQTNYPDYDTRPRSPFYNWLAWMRQNLNQRDVDTYTELDKHLQNPHARVRILRKAQLELCQLWDWQHRRSALGLSLRSTKAEEDAALAAMHSKQSKRALAGLQTAHQYLLEAHKLEQQASERTDTQHYALLAKALRLKAHAARSHLDAHVDSPNLTRPVRLKAVNQAVKEVDALTQRVVLRVEAMKKAPVQHETSPAAPQQAEVEVHDKAHVAAATTTPQRQAVIQLFLRQLEKVVKRICDDTEFREEDVLRKVREMQPSNRNLDDEAAEVLSKHATGQAHSAEPAASVAGVAHAAAGDDKSSTADGGAEAAAPSASMSPHVPDQTTAKQQTPSGAGSIAQRSIGSVGREGVGLLAAMQAAAKTSQSELTSQQTQWLRSAGVTDHELAMLQRLRKSTSVATGPSATSSAMIFSQLAARLANQAKDFKARVRSPNVSGKSSRYQQRLYTMLEHEYLHRTALSAGTATQATARADVGNATAQLYSSGHDPSAAVGGVHVEKTPGRVADGALLTEIARAAAAEAKQQSAMQQQGKSSSPPALTTDASSSSVSLTWSDVVPSEHIEEDSARSVKKAAQSAQSRSAASSAAASLSVLNLDAPGTYRTATGELVPYDWDLGLPPPTPTLQLVTDYLQVKYQDVFMRRDAAARVEAAICGTSATAPTAPSPDLNSDGSDASAPVNAVKRVLSPHEVAEINSLATHLFSAGKVVEYSRLLNRLTTHDLLKPSETLELVAAAQRHAVDLKEAVESSGKISQNAESLPERVDRPQDEVQSSVPASDQAALVALLNKPMTESAPHTLGNKTRSTTTADDPLVTAEWSRALAQGAVHLKSLWTMQLSEAAADAMSATRAPNAGDAQVAGAALRASILNGDFVSWKEACQLWDRYLDAATEFGERANMPSLSDVISADVSLRRARIKLQRTGDTNDLQMAEKRADVLNKQLDALHQRFLQRVTTAFNPGGTMPPAATTTAMATATTTTTATATGLRDDVISAIRNFNSMLLNGKLRPKQLLSSLQGFSTPDDVLKAHAEQIISKAQLGTTNHFVWQPNTSAWEQIWSLLRALYTLYLTPARQRQDHTPTATATANKSIAAVANPNEVATAESAAQLQQSAIELKRKWRRYCNSQDQRAPREGAAAGLTAGSSSTGLQADAQLAPPFPGARPILRFTQCFVLGPVSDLSSTQGLAERWHARQETNALAARLSGHRPPPVLLPDHPAAKRVLLRVQVRDLAEEVGLSDEGIQHLLRIAGTYRYDAHSGDLVLLGTQYRTREDNRRWCLETLHVLIHEAHHLQEQQQQQQVAQRSSRLKQDDATALSVAVQPLKQHAAGSSVLVLERPGVVSLAHGKI